MPIWPAHLNLEGVTQSSRIRTAFGTTPHSTEHIRGRNRSAMKRALAAVMSLALVFAFSPLSEAAAPCPPEVSQAKDLLAKKGSAANVQAPRSLAGARQD